MESISYLILKRVQDDRLGKFQISLVRCFNLRSAIRNLNLVMSPVLSRPIIRDILPMGRETVLIWSTVIIDLIRNVDNDRFLFADAFPSMIDPIGHLNQQGVVDSNKEFIDLPFGRRTFSWIIKDQFDHPLDGTDVIGLDFMI